MNKNIPHHQGNRILRRLFLLSIIGLFSFSTLEAQVVNSTVTPLSPVTILTNTSELPQSKVWAHAGKHFTVLGTSAGTVIMRLDGTTWTNVLTLASGNFVKADIKTVGDIVHILVYKGSSSVLYSVEYVPANATYKLWTVRKNRVDFTMEGSNQTVTIDIDATGRMWMASDGARDVNVRWSDAPYAVWSAPIKLETNTSTTDMCAVVALPGKIGVFWSNKVTKRFAFRTHDNGADPSVWSADEAPASQSALNVGTGFAENQFNLKVAPSGKLYVSVKTGYNSVSNTQLALLVRETSGTWHDAYPVTVGSGQRPMIIINEALDVLKVVYTSASGIAYKQSKLNPISFGAETTLLSGAYDNVTGAKNPYTGSSVVLASSASSAVGAIIEDVLEAIDDIPPTVSAINRLTPSDQNTNATTVTYRVVFSETVTGVTASDFSATAVSGAVAGTIGGVTPVGSEGTTYDIEVNAISGFGTLRLDLAASGTGIADQAGNDIEQGFTTGQTYIFTQPAPTLTSVAIASNNDNAALAKPGDIVTLSFTASTAVNLPVVTIAGHSVTVVPQGGNSFQATHTLTAGDAEGGVAFLITFATTAGTEGVPVSATTNNSEVVFDKTLPQAQSINRQDPSTQTISASSVIYRVVFSEKVTGVTVDDFVFTQISGGVTGVIAPGAVTPVGSAGTTYDVEVSSIDGSGTFQLDLNGSGTSIADATGNAINGGFSTGQTYIISHPAPELTTVTVQSNNTNSALAKVGDEVTLSFTASRSIQAPVVTIAGNAVTATATGGANSYEAKYTLVASDTEGEVAFNITFTATDGTAGVAVNATTNSSKVTFDKTQPTAESINRQVPTTQNINATSVTYRVVFSEKVTGVDAADFTFTAVSGSVTGTLASDAVTPVGSAGTTYDVTVTSINSNGTFQLDLTASGTSVADAAGNAINGGFNTGETYIISEPAPTLTSVAIASNNNNTARAKPGDIVTLSFTASTAVDLPVVTIAGHFVTVVPQSGNSFEATRTLAAGDDEGAVTFLITFATTSGVGGVPVHETTNNSEVVFDKTVPTVSSINRQVPSEETTDATTITYRVVFSEKVTGVNADDFTLTVVNGSPSGTVANDAVTAVGSEGTTYDVAVTSVAGNGTLRLDLNASGTGIADQPGNDIAAGFSSGQTYIIAQAAPTLTSVAIASNNANTAIAKPGDAVTLSFTSSRSIDLPVVTIAGHAVTAVSQGGNDYAATYTMNAGDAEGAVAFTISFTATDGTAGVEVNATTDNSEVVFDKTVPTAESINRQVPSDETTDATTVTYRVVFSEKVTGVNADDFTLTVVNGSASGTLANDAVTPVGSEGTTYDVAVTSVAGNGTLRLDLNASGTGIADQPGNDIAAGFTSGQTYIIAQAAPTLTSVAIASNNANTAIAKPGDAVTLSFTSSRSIDLPVVTIAGHAVTAVSQGGNAYEATYTMVAGDAEGAVPFTIAFTATDGTAGAEVNATTDNSEVVFDKTVPTVSSINRHVPSDETTDAITVTYRVVFSEKVTGVNADDFTLTVVNGSASGTVASDAVTPVGTQGTTYDVAVTSVAGNGTVRLDLNASGTGISDQAGNDIAAGFASGQTYIIAQAAPTLTSVAIVSNNANTAIAKPGDAVALSFTSSRSIDLPVVTIAGHTVTAVSQGGNDYSATYTMVAGDAEGAVAFTIAFTATDGTAGVEVNATTDNSEVVFDKTVPTAETINRQVPSEETTDATTITYRVVFSEKVTGVNADDFTLTVVNGSPSGTVANDAVTAVGSEGTTYDVAVTSIAGNGTLRLDLNASATGIADQAGNDIAAGFTSGQTYIIAQAAPTLTSVAIVSNNANTAIAKPGDAITLSFTSSRSIDLPVVTIAGHAVTAVSQGGNAYEATYTMVGGDAEGAVAFTIAFTANDGTAGVEVNATTNNSEVIFDKTVPTAESINRQVPSEETTDATTVTYRVVFSEKVTGVNADDFTLTVVNGSASGTVANDAVTAVGSEGTTYDVAVTSIAGNGTLRLDLNASGTGIADQPGNDIAADFTSGQTYIIAQAAPTLTSVGIVSNNTNTAITKPGDAVTLSFTSSRSIDLPVVTIAGHAVTAVSQGGNAYAATYTMIAGDAEGAVPFTIAFTATDGTAGIEVNATTNSSEVVFDKTVPTAESINRQVPSEETTDATTVTYRVVFSEKVTGVNADDFTLTVVNGSPSGTLASDAVTAVGSEGTTYDVAVTSVAGNGTLRLDLNAGGTGIADQAGNNITVGFTSGETYIKESPPILGGSTITPLTPTSILTNTAEIQQSKIWTHAGKQFCVLGTSAGSIIMRLDGTTWTNIFTLASGSSIKADVKTAGEVVHILVHKGSTSVLYSVEYVPANSTYKAWTVRKTRVDFTMESGSQTATIDIDGTGRMWMVSDGTRDVNVRWSDAPYSTWSAPIKLETNTNTGDLCAVVAMPGKIGVFWSNKLTKRFAFKTHTDGADPSVWSADEAPASQSALEVGTGFAENQFNLKVSPSGRLYVSVKTGYNSVSHTQLALLVRQPNGVWDNAYPVTVGSGLRPIVIINETFNMLKVVYTGGGGIVYKQSSLYPISFGTEQPLISGAYDNVSSAKLPFGNTAVVLASNASTAVGALIVNEELDNVPPTIQSINRFAPSVETTDAATVTYRVVFSEKVTGVDVSDFSATTVSGSVAGTLAVDAVTPVGTEGTTYDVAITSITSTGTLRLDLKASGTGIADVAGNNIAGGFTSGQTYIITQLPPTLSAVAVASNNTNTAVAKPGDVVTLTFTSSRAINPPLVTIAGHSVTATLQGGNSYQAAYTMVAEDAEGEVPFTIDFTAIDGLAGVTVNETTNNSEVVFDKTVPAVQSINRQVPTSQNTNASSVTYRVVFSERVTGVDAGDLTLTVVDGSPGGTLAGDAVIPVGSAGTTYDVTITAITGNGTLRVDLNASGTGIADHAGNQISGGFNTGQTYIIAQPAPTLTSVTIASNNTNTAVAKTGDVVTLSFTSSRSINLPVVTIAGHSVIPVLQAGNSYQAAYTMVAGDAEGAIAFNIAFTATDGTAGVAVTATTNSSQVVFDKTKPVVGSISRQNPANQNITQTSVTYRAIFLEKVTGVDAADFTVTSVSGSVSGTLLSNAVTPVGSNGTTYDVEVTSIAGNGSLRLDLKSSGTGIIDAAGNEHEAGFTSGDTYIRNIAVGVGFASITQLTPLAITSETKDKPQSKVWKYNNTWWAALAVSGGTKIFRLDNTTWTPVLTLKNTTSKPDIKVVGDVVHVMMYKGDGSTSLLYSIEHVPSNNTYKLWTVRPTSTPLDYPSGTETATITIDGTGRMWTTTAGTSQIYVWYSDYPYTAWSERIEIGSGVKDDDISAIVTLPNENKIAVLWSNQNTKRLGFKTHVDGSDPNVWSADEVPASQSAIDNVGAGMADDHLNIKVTSDGTLYCATKTSYNKSNYAKVALLVRRPNGTWDNLYTVTMEPLGTQPAVLVNEAQGTLKVLYCSEENGGIIIYRQSPLSNISFGAPQTVISNGSTEFDYVSSISTSYSSEVLILATNLSSNPKQAVGVLASDDQPGGFAMSSTLSSFSPLDEPAEASTPERMVLARKAMLYPNPFTNSATLNFTLDETAQYSILLYDNRGRLISMIKQGYGTAGIPNSVRIQNTGLAAGIYYVKLQTRKGVQTFKLMKEK